MAGLPGIGMRSFFGFGEESTYGSPVTRTNYIEINSESFMKQVARLESSSIIRRGILNTKVGAGAISLEGDVEFDAHYDGWLKLAKHAMGTVTTTQPDVTNAPTAYNHQFTIADTLPTGLTVEIFRDNAQFTTEPNKSFLYKGCKVNSMQLSCGVDEILKVTCGLVGQDEGRVAKSTDSYNTARFAMYHQGVVLWNGEDIEVSQFSVTVDNQYAARPKLGSQFTREYLPDQKIAVSGSLTAEFSSWNQYDDFINTTEREMIATFTGPTIAGSITYLIKLTMPIALLNNVRIMLNQPGRIMAEMDFKAYRTASANELTMDVRNISSTV